MLVLCIWTILILTSKPEAPQNAPQSYHSMSHRREMNSLENCYLPPLNFSPSHLLVHSIIVIALLWLLARRKVCYMPHQFREVVPSTALVCPALCNTGSFFLTISLGICILLELLGTENIFSDAWTIPHSIQ